ncbi:MAG: hypothetical protein ABSA53_37610 [Streptosporangiaceae bacterium]|jgi:hypothetical protein
MDRPCCGLTWLRWIRLGLEAHHSTIGRGEVITDAQYGVPGSLGTKGSPAGSPLFAIFCSVGIGQLAIVVSGVTVTGGEMALPALRS